LRVDGLPKLYFLFTDFFTLGETGPVIVRHETLIYLPESDKIIRGQNHGAGRGVPGDG
jgi:hypothetical protein